ncbi:MAG: hypothetical protein Q9M97_05385 [Candidatus Gracilibacteria bacterium]|nr:hypothetical protein [Candidatus Gracilibacteria bacterium]
MKKKKIENFLLNKNKKNNKLPEKDNDKDKNKEKARKLKELILKSKINK